MKVRILRASLDAGIYGTQSAFTVSRLRVSLAIYDRVSGREAVVPRMFDCCRDPTLIRRALHEKA